MYKYNLLSLFSMVFVYMISRMITFYWITN